MFNKCVSELSQRLWNVWSHLMDQRIQVTWMLGKQQLASAALRRNPVWPGTVENSVEEGLDSWYAGACYIANEYRREHMFEDELCDPMIE